jgi:hypothetical protein
MITNYSYFFFPSLPTLPLLCFVRYKSCSHGFSWLMLTTFISANFLPPARPSSPNLFTWDKQKGLVHREREREREMKGYSL